MTFEELLASMTPEIHATMKTAVEIGKWPDGRKLTQDERETCLQAVIAYDAQHLDEEQRVGFIDTAKKEGSCSSSPETAEENVSIKPITH